MTNPAPTPEEVEKALVAIETYPLMVSRDNGRTFKREGTSPKLAEAAALLRRALEPNLVLTKDLEEARRLLVEVDKGTNVWDWRERRDALLARLANPQSGEGTEDPQTVVNEQAEDAGLWFHPIYASEALLQAALRRLHAAIEGVSPTEAALDALHQPTGKERK